MSLSRWLPSERLNMVARGIVSRIRPEMRKNLGGIALFLAITMLFCLIQSAIDGVVKRNPDFDKYRWWYPIYSTYKTLIM